MEILSHTVAVIALLAAYVIVTVTGHDGTALLAALGGYAGGTGMTKVNGRLAR